MARPFFRSTCDAAKYLIQKHRLPLEPQNAGPVPNLTDKDVSEMGWITTQFMTEQRARLAALRARPRRAK